MSMLESFPLQFERPLGLLLLLLLIPIVYLARRSHGWGKASGGAMTTTKAWVSLGLRAMVVLLLALAISQPTLVKRGEGLSLVVVADRSASIPQRLRDQSERWLHEVGNTKRPEDRVGTIVVGGEPEILSRPETNAIVPESLSFLGDPDATDLASALRLALSIAPKDTATRLLLVSDGNENRGNLLKEAEAAAANGIPIDVVITEFEHPNEIVFEQIQAPARSRIGATQDIRLFIRSQSEAQARLLLRENGRPIDLDPAVPGDTMVVDLKAGPNVITVPVSFDEGGAQRFEATLEPLGEGIDAVLENNRGTAVTFVAGGGKVLILDSGGESESLVRALREGGLTVDVRTAAEIVDPATMLNGYDALVLANVPRWDVDPALDRAIRASVHDMGVGLLMLGGPNSFGAGGWMESEVEKALPVKLDPPASRQLVRGALAIIVHACEWPTANYWAQTVTIAAIQALSRLDLIGIITFGGLGGHAWHHPLQEAGDKSAAIAAAKSMVVGDMQDFEGCVALAYQGLSKTNAGQKHIIIISDGDPAPPTPATLANCKNAKITITTVMLAGGLGHGTQGDYQNMRYTATTTGGRFHEVKNPKQLPQIFTKEATVVSRSLISEGRYSPQVQTSLSGPLKGITAVPEVQGYVVTVGKPGLAQTSIQVSAKEGNDPLYAWWNYGVGRSVAFTSDATNRWGSAWTNWSDYRAFWEQTIRWLMRPPSPSNIALRTRIDGETVIVEMEAVGEDNAGFVNFLKSEASVLLPDGEAKTLDMQQIGPGRYRSEFAAASTGGYLVNIAVPVERDGTTVMSSVQAAVNIPYPKEYRTVRDNGALLRRVAEMTGGRVLAMTDARTVGAFDRAGLPVPSSAKRIWDLMTYLAAAILLIDVAVRRLAIERGFMRRLAERILGRTERVGEGTVAAWKTARQKAEGKGAGAGGTAGGTAGGATAAERRERAEAAKAAAGARFDETEGGPSIDVAGEAKGQPGDRLAGGTGERGSGKGEPPSEAKPAEDDGMSRLLKAKRRARTDGDDATGGPGRG